MPEELRIVVVDQGGAAPSRGPTAPGGGQPARGPVSGGGPRAFPVLQRPGQQPPGPRAVVGADGSRRAISAIGTAGGVAGAAAAGNVAGAASGASAGIVAAVGGPVGIAVAAVAAGLGVAAIAARKFAQVVESQTSRLAGFSGPLAAAQAQTELRRELGLLRRAQRIGPELASAERLRSQFESTMTDLATEVLQILLGILEELRPVIEFVIDGMKAVTSFLEEYGDTIGKAALLMLAKLDPLAAAAILIARLFQGEVDRREDEEIDDPFTQQFLDLLPRDAHGQPLFWPAGQPVPQPGV